MRGVTQSEYYQLRPEEIVNRAHQAMREQLRRDDLLRRIVEFEAEFIAPQLQTNEIKKVTV